MKSFLGYLPDFELPGEAAPLSSTQLIRRELRARSGAYVTSLQLAELTGLPVRRVHGALEVLMRYDKVERQRPRGSAGQSYKWRETPG